MLNWEINPSVDDDGNVGRRRDDMKTGFQNWKTTIIGAVIAGLYALQNADNMTAKHAIVAFAIAAFGFVCADGNNVAKVQG